MPNTSPHLVFLDVETSGLEASQGHELIELAYLTEDEPTPKTLYFGITREQLRALDPTNFIDGFIGFSARGLSGRRSSDEEIEDFLDISTKATMVAANPAFDESFLKKAGLWQMHHRKWDIESYAAGKLNLGYLPGMADIVTLLTERGHTISTFPDHTAATDTIALYESFQILRYL